MQKKLMRTGSKMTKNTTINIINVVHMTFVLYKFSEIILLCEKQTEMKRLTSVLALLGKFMRVHKRSSDTLNKSFF